MSVYIPFSENSFSMLLLMTTKEFQRYGLFKETTKHENMKLELLAFTAAISPVSDSNYFKWRLEKLKKMWRS